MQSVTDTPPEITEMVHARLMALSGAERFLMGIRMCAAARRMVLASLPADLPESERSGFFSSGSTAKGMAKKSKEFVENGAEVYAQA